MKKMYILLVHGTWAGAARWTHPGSTFRRGVEEELKKLGYDTRFETFPWNGANRWRARYEVTQAVNDHLNKVVAERGNDWEFLVVAHSHGGNIATEAVRKRLQEDPGLPIRGVVCLNTPFITHQLRGSNGFLLAWLLSASLLWAGLCCFGDSNAPLALAGRLGNFAQRVGVSLDQGALRFGLVTVMAMIAGLFLISKQIQRKEHGFPWEPRPRVLCLSCPDDEAITFLGLGEGIANLPQLLVHPLSFVLFLLLGALLLYKDGLSWCGLSDSACWEGQLSTISVMFVSWLVLALAGGIIGTLLVTLLFGLSVQQAFKTLVSRVLVSYVPLRPSKSHFRGINDIPLKWSPFQLFHSGIYESSQTVDELCAWLRRYPLRRRRETAAESADKQGPGIAPRAKSSRSR